VCATHSQSSKNANSLLIFVPILFFVSKVSIGLKGQNELPFLFLFHPFCGGPNLLDLVKPLLLLGENGEPGSP
jgi:hypothetical protein